MFFVANNKIDDTDETLVLNINSDRDLGENKYKRRPLLEWLSRLLKLV